MTNQMFNPQPCYSGVTIQIANPMVNAGIPNNTNPNYANVYPGYITDNSPCGCPNKNYGNTDRNQFVSNPYALNTASSLYRNDNQYADYNAQYTQDNITKNNQTIRDREYIRNSQISDIQNTRYIGNTENSEKTNNGYSNAYGTSKPTDSENYPSAYPAQYYINNYGNGGIGVNSGVNNGTNDGVNAGADDRTTGANQYTSDSNFVQKQNANNSDTITDYRTNNNYSNRQNNDNYNDRTENDSYKYNSENQYSDRNINNNTYSSNLNEKYNNSYNRENTGKNNLYSGNDYSQNADNASSGYIAQGTDEFAPNEQMTEDNVGKMNNYKIYADKNEPKPDSDMQTSQTIIEDLDQRVAEREEEKKNTKETKIVALTDEYIKSLENYLNNPNDEIRLMASKEILTRLDEDHDRNNDAALNALLNKMLQDPSKLIRIAALSAFASQLACGNDYTVQLLQNIQSNPNADKEDVLQAADILLKMSAGVEIKNIPNPSAKENQQQPQQAGN